MAVKKLYMVAPIRIFLTFGKWTLMDWKDMLLAIVNDSLRITQNLRRLFYESFTCAQWNKLLR